MRAHRYRSNHDDAGNPAYVPGGYPIEETMTMNAQMTATREALSDGYNPKLVPLDERAAALAEIEEWEDVRTGLENLVRHTLARAEAAEAERDRLKAALEKIAERSVQEEARAWDYEEFARAALGEQT